MAVFDHNAAYYIAILALALTPVQLILAGISARKEWDLGQAIAVLLFLADIAFVSFQLYYLYQSRVEGEFVTSGVHITVYAAIALPILTFTIVIACICTRNFGKGLKPNLQQSRIPADTVRDNARAREAAYTRAPSEPLYALPPRLEID
jgi:hypothetical protein